MTQEEIRQTVKEAVAEALKGANLIDGPTHIAHHQAFQRALDMRDHVYKVGAGALAVSFLGVLLLGFFSWIKKGLGL